MIMTKYDLEPIVKTYYKALEEGTILGRKCKKCGHIEFPPYLCCNACGGLDTEWVDLTNMRGVVKQVLLTRGASGFPQGAWRLFCCRSRCPGSRSVQYQPAACGL